MISGIKDPNIASGFAALANILAPNASGMIEADLSRVKRDGMLADTRRTGADQARIEAVTRGTDATTATTTRENQAAADLAAILADPAFDPATPEGRRRISAAAVQARDGLAKGAAGVTGYSSYIDPNFAGDADAFSSILMGTGIVPNFANTPRGFEDDQSRLRADATAKNAVTLQTNEDDNITSQANNAATNATSVANNANTAQTSEANAAAAQVAAMERLEYSTLTPKAPGAGVTPTPLTLNVEDGAKLNEAVGLQLESLFDGAAIEPGAVAQIQTRAAQLYQTTRNAQAAITQAIGEANLASVTTGGDDYIPFNESTNVRSGVADVLAPPGAPAAAPVTGTDKAGRAIVWDAQAGAWKYPGPVAP